MKELDLKEDLKYLASYRTAKSSLDFYHTVGNMG